VTVQRNRQRGFSLVELLIGIVLAMIAVIVVMQIFQYNEARQRTSTGGDSAIMDGAIAITELQRDLRQSGMGMASLSLLGCGITLPNSAALPAVAPVVINSSILPGGDANTDTLLIAYGNGNGSPEGDRVLSQPNSTTFNVNTPTAFVAQDYVIAASNTQLSPCNLLLDRVANVNGESTGGTVTTSTGTLSTGDALFNWGQAPHVVAYRVSGGRLVQCDFMIADCRTTNDGVWTELQDGVISLRAQYGHDTSSPMDGIVDVYDQTTPALNTPTSNCLWARTNAVRLALTVRNGQMAGPTEVVTTTAPTWTGSAAAPIVVSGNANWKRYRYRVFETVVPLRNIAWLATPGVINLCP